MSDPQETDHAARAWLTPNGTDALERLGAQMQRERSELDPVLVQIVMASRCADGFAPLNPLELFLAMHGLSAGAPLRDGAKWVLATMLEHGDLAKALAAVPTSPPVLAVDLARTTWLSYEEAREAIARVGLDRARIAERIYGAGGANSIGEALDAVAMVSRLPHPLEVRAVLDENVVGFRVAALPRGAREARGMATDEAHEPDDRLLLTKQKNPADNGLYLVGEVDEAGTAPLARVGMGESITGGSTIRTEDGRVYQAHPVIPLITVGTEESFDFEVTPEMEEEFARSCGLTVDVERIAYDPATAGNLAAHVPGPTDRIPLNVIVPYTFYKRFRILPRPDGSGTGAPRHDEALARMRAKLAKIDEAD